MVKQCVHCVRWESESVCQSWEANQKCSSVCCVLQKPHHILDGHIHGALWQQSHIRKQHLHGASGMHTGL